MFDVYRDLDEMISKANRLNRYLKDNYASQIVVDNYDSEGLSEHGIPLGRLAVDQYRRRPMPKPSESPAPLDGEVMEIGGVKYKLSKVER